MKALPDFQTISMSIYFKGSNGRDFEIDPIWRSCRESSCGIYSDPNIVKQADISIM